MGLALVIVMLLVVIYALHAVVSNWKQLKQKKVIVSASLAVAAVLAVILYFMPFSIPIPQNCKIECHGYGGEKITVTDPESVDQIRELLDSLKLQRVWHNIPSRQAAEGMTIYLRIWDQGIEPNERSIVHGNYDIAVSYPEKSMYYPFGKEMEFEVLNAETIIPELMEILGITE